ncbi:TniQ family protein [Paraburkholderia nemoris]|uniref:TniQ family protein n=1 Tax=Paraburkholderia TaxID=1822464 RepID=UPI0038BA16C9
MVNPSCTLFHVPRYSGTFVSVPLRKIEKFERWMNFDTSWLAARDLADRGVAMTIFLAEPLIDEPLFSCAARYMSDINARPASVMQHLFGYRAHPSSLAFGLSQVERVTRDCWGLSARELAQQRTNYPYFAALLAPSQANSLFEKMLYPIRRGHAPHVHHERGAARCLQYCKVCFGEDLQNGVPRHWRRAHQLPGVCVCPWHGVMLWQILDPALPREGYILPQDLLVLRSSQLSIKMSDAQLQACHQVARLSYGLLINKVSVDAGSFWEQVLKFARGKTLTGIELSTLRDLEVAMHSYFGSDFLRWVGVPDGHDSKIARRLCGSRNTNSMMPVMVVLLAACCDAMSGEHVSGPLLRRVGKRTPIIYCANIGAAHGPRHSVDAIRRRGDNYVARCNCGAHFKFSNWSGHNAIDAHPCRPGGRSGKGGRRSILGQTVLALRAQGKSRREIAMSLRLDMKTVANLERMRAKSVLHQSTNEISRVQNNHR